MQASPSATALRLLAIVLACALVAACGGAGPRAMAALDPAFAYLYPGARASFSKLCRSVVELPFEESGPALYEALDEADPDIVYLTPLLAGEVQGMLGNTVDMRIAYLGESRLRDDDRLYAAVWSPVDAARAAGAALAASSRESGKRGRGPLTAAVFAGVDAEAASEAFLAAYREAGGLGEPIVELNAGDFDPAAAERLRTMDIGCAYIGAGAADAARWSFSAFDEAAFVAVRAPLPDAAARRSMDAVVSWDLDATLEALGKRLADSSPGSFPGSWRILEAEAD